MKNNERARRSEPHRGEQCDGKVKKLEEWRKKMGREAADQNKLLISSNNKPRGMLSQLID